MNEKKEFDLNDENEINLIMVDNDSNDKKVSFEVFINWLMELSHTYFCLNKYI